MGMGKTFRSHVHDSRLIVNSSVNKFKCNQELKADSKTYLQWFATYQTANKYTDSRSYAEVLSCTPPLHLQRK